MNAPTRLTTATIGLLGVWLLASPFLLDAPPVDWLNDVLVGGTIVVFAGYNHLHDRVHGTPSRGGSVAHVVLGVWLLFAPFVSSVTGPLLWNDIAVGVLVSAFAGYNVYAASLDAHSVVHVTVGGT